MKNKFISFMLALSMIATILSFAANAFESDDYYITDYVASTSNSEVTVLNNNVISTYSTATISSSGKISINVEFTGISGTTTKGVITTYIEKKTLGLFWTRVNIGQANNEWVDTIYNYHYNGSHSYNLNSRGTYRVKVNYTIYGNGGSPDNIDWQKNLSY